MINLKKISILALLLFSSSSLLSMEKELYSFGYYYNTNESEKQKLSLSNEDKLWLAITKDVPMVEKLEEIGKALKNDPNVINMTSRYPSPKNRNLLDYALRKNDIPLFLYLLNKGIEVNKQDEEGKSPAQWILLSDLKPDEVLTYIKALDKYKANFNLANNSGETPLHTAVRAKNKDLVEFLLNKGANPNTQRNDGKTPLDSAKQYKLTKIQSLLEDALKKQEQLEDIETKNLADEIKKQLEKNSSDYGMNQMIFKFAPDKDQKDFRAYTDKRELYTITSYKDKDNEIHYTIEYHNPFDKRSFYNKRGFIEPRQMSKEEFEEKKETIEKLSRNRNSEQFRCIHNSSLYPEIKYIQGTKSISKKGNTFTRLEGTQEFDLSNPKNWAFEMDTNETTNKKWKNTFDTTEQNYNKQQRLLKILHKEFMKKEPKEEFKEEFKFPYDFKFFYNN